jgi:hypothetical protein
LRPAARLRCPDRAFAVIVALAVLLGGMPLTLGIVVHGSETTFTLDICHPVQSFSHSPVSVVAIIPGSPAVAQSLPECGHYPSAVQALRVRVADAPDPPPPKARA